MCVGTPMGNPVSGLRGGDELYSMRLSASRHSMPPSTTTTSSSSLTYQAYTAQSCQATRVFLPNSHSLRPGCIFLQKKLFRIVVPLSVTFFILTNK